MPGLSSALFAQSAPPPAGTPDWPVATAPARFQMDSDQPDRTSLLGYAEIYLPDPKWANLPLRVFTDTGVAVGSDVLSAAPGEPIRLIFDSSAHAKHYQVYLGSNWPPMHLMEKRAGVWLETRAGDGKVITNLPDMLKAWNAGTTILGRALLPSIFEGGNRFGPQGNLFLHFQGWFELASPAHLDLAVISVDSAFVLVDDKEVVEWPGLHDWGGGMTGQHQGGVDLPAGLHYLDYYNAYLPSEGGRPPVLTCLAAKGGPLPGWTMLTSNNSFFRPAIHYGTGGYALQPGTSSIPGARTVDFDWGNAAQSMINTDQPDVGLVEMTFFCQTSLPGVPNWTFDDGATAQGGHVNHLFARPGLRPVTLTIKDGDKVTGSVTEMVNVHPDWKDPGKQPEIHPEHEADIMARDPAAMSVPDLASCFAVFGNFRKTGGLLKMLPAVCAKMKDIGDADLPYISNAAFFLVQDDWAHADEEMQLLHALVDRTSVANSSPQFAVLSSESRLRLAQLTLKNSDRTDEVGSLIAGINVATLTGEEPRMLKILQADLALATGDVAGAKKQYDNLTGQPTGPDARSSIRRTARISQARAFMDRKDFSAADDALREVAWQEPIEKMAPEWALTRLRLYQEQKLQTPAYLWAKRLLPVITEGGRSELLFRLTDIALAQKDEALAHKTLDELMKKHPYSEEAAQAKEKWPAAE